MTLLTTNEVADLLGITRRGVHSLIKRNRLPAEKIGRDWIIRSEDLQEYWKRRRPPGRPSKSEEEN